MNKLSGAIITLVVALFAFAVLTTGTSYATVVDNNPTPTPTCTPTPTATPTVTPTPTPCTGNLCIDIHCDGGGTCEFSNTTPTPTPQEPTVTPNVPPSDHGDGRSDGGSSGGSSSSPSQSVLGIMAPTGSFEETLMGLMFLSGILVLGLGYRLYGKNKKA